MSSLGEDPHFGSSREQPAATARRDETAEVDLGAPISDPAGVMQCPEFAANDRADYQLTSGLFRELVGVRFRLLGFLPTVSGAILTVLSALELAPEVVIGPVLVGLVVTWGLMLYEVRNSQIHDNAVHRSKHLEKLLGLSPSIPSSSPGGFFGERTKLQLFLVPLTSSSSSETSGDKDEGLAPVKHDSALSIVYGVVLASWAAVLAFNVVRFLDEHNDQVDNGSNDLAWRVSIGVRLLVGLVGWRAVSALSRRAETSGSFIDCPRLPVAKIRHGPTPSSASSRRFTATHLAGSAATWTTRPSQATARCGIWPWHSELSRIVGKRGSDRSSSSTAE